MLWWWSLSIDGQSAMMCNRKWAKVSKHIMYLIKWAISVATMQMYLINFLLRNGFVVITIACSHCSWCWIVIDTLLSRLICDSLQCFSASESTPLWPSWLVFSLWSLQVQRARTPLNDDWFRHFILIWSLAAQTPHSSPTLFPFSERGQSCLGEETATSRGAT